MPDSVILASGSATRLGMLRNAGVPVLPLPASIDEEAVTSALEAEGATPREIANALAELKAVRISQKHPDSLVVGCDQVLEFNGRTVGKCRTLAESRQLLKRLRGKSHELHSAAVVCQSARAIWRHTDSARIAMKNYSDGYLDMYVQRNADQILESVGCYQIEGEGVRLIGAISGDFFTVCGMPLRPLLAYLEDLGVLER